MTEQEWILYGTVAIIIIDWFCDKKISEYVIKKLKNK